MPFLWVLWGGVFGHGSLQYKLVFLGEQAVGKTSAGNVELRSKSSD